MTLEELVSTNGSICKITIDVRDKGHLIQAYHIGPFESEDRYADPEHGIEPRWICIKTPINHKDLGKEYWGVILSAIPKKLLKLEVTSWNLWDGWTSNNGLNKHRWLNVNVEGSDAAVLEDKKPAVICTNNQLEGQMDITDFLEVK